MSSTQFTWRASSWTDMRSPCSYSHTSKAKKLKTLTIICSLLELWPRGGNRRSKLMSLSLPVECSILLMMLGRISWLKSLINSLRELWTSTSSFIALAAMGTVQATQFTIVSMMELTVVSKHRSLRSIDSVSASQPKMCWGVPSCCDVHCGETRDSHLS